jgi:predicted TIM-barrel fold metal-dependent hydrolase
MWGSDFPCELWLRGKATYQEHLALFTTELGLSAGERASILEHTPTRIWFPEQVRSLAICCDKDPAADSRR